MTRDELNEMTKPELIKHGEGLGIKLTPAESKGDMIDRILGIPVEVKKERDANLPPEGSLYTLQGEKITDLRKFKVTIHATESERSDVCLAVNGHLVKVQRNVEVVLSEPYVEVLKNAVIETVQKDPDTGKASNIRIMNYPFTAVPV